MGDVVTQRFRFRRVFGAARQETLELESSRTVAPGEWGFRHEQHFAPGAIGRFLERISDLPLTARLAVALIAYFVAANLGWAYSSAVASPIWPASGVGFLALAILGMEVWPAILLGAFLADLLNGGSGLALVSGGVIAAAEAFAAIAVLRIARFKPSLETLRDVTLFLCTAIVVTGLAGIATAFVGFVDTTARMGGPEFLAWWGGDTLGILVVGGLVLAYGFGTPIPSSPSALGKGAPLTMTALICGASIASLVGPQLGLPELHYLMLAPAVWIAMRYGPRGGALAMTGIYLTTVIGELLVRDAATPVSFADPIIMLQLFLGVAAITVYSIAAMSATSAHVAAAFAASERKYRTVFDAISDAVLVQDVVSGEVLEINESGLQLWSANQREFVAANPPSARVANAGYLPHAVWEQLRSAPEGPISFDWRAQRPDNQWIWVEVDARKSMIEGVERILVTARDVTARKAAERAAAGSEQRYRQMVYDVVESMGKAVETRDPYTSGHQRRVAGIAMAIAREMGLSEDQIVSIEMTGLVHDVGKIGVPAEILSKPGALSATEFGIIKGHPQAGADILAEIDFPWPIAEIVLQHHERLDGTGYPRGLSGDQIVLEARILAVADVVEAMASHRPYRVALGLEAAIEEISRSQGKFDPDVCDACVRLFSEGKIALTGTRDWARVPEGGPQVR